MIKKSFFTFLFPVFFLDFGFSQLQPGFQRPVMYAKVSDKPKILNKIARYAWANKLFNQLRDRVEPYANRHLVDPEWILSRMAMNWDQGRRYTTVSIGGPFVKTPRLNTRRGNAPVPTPKFNGIKHNGEDPYGNRFVFPATIEERDAYIGDTAYLKSKGGTSQRFATKKVLWWGGWNGIFRSLALDAAILYWLTREEKYAKLSADILMQIFRGASYMTRPSGSDVAGLFTLQTISDGLIYIFHAYDLLHDYIMENNDDLYYDSRYIDSETGYYPPNSQFHPTNQDTPGRDMRYIDPETGRESIELMMDDFAYRYGLIFTRGGAFGSNWGQVETGYTAILALTISDRNKNKRLELMTNVIHKDYKRSGGTFGTYGAATISTLLKEDYNSRGLNKEPLGYHEYPMRRLTETVIVLENAGYNIMGNSKYRALFKGTYVVSDYTFPNDYGSAFGDGGTLVQPPNLLEVGYKFAKKYNHPDKDRIAYELYRLINGGLYVRGEAELAGESWESVDLSLLVYEGSIEKPSIKVVKNRSDEIDFANHYSQRNGIHELEGLMYTINAGGEYPHSSSQGLTIELYGKGMMLGIDSGTENYSSDRWVLYQTSPASHNTVIPDERILKDSARTTRTGNETPANLISIDPPLESKIGISDNNSFSLTSFNYRGKQQRRNIMINRTSEKSGYYLDVFWSEGSRTLDYVYHNLSGGVPDVKFIENGLIKETTSVNDLANRDLAYNWFNNQKRYTSSNNVQVEFKVDLNRFDKNVYMKSWVIGENNRKYYKAGTTWSSSVPSKFQNHNHINSVMVIRDTSPNFNTKPFVILYEPYRGDGRSVIDHVRRMDGTKGRSHYVGVVVSNSDRGRDRPDVQYLISSKNNNTAFDHEGVQFKGYSATVSHNDGELTSLYLGKGSYLSNHGYRIEKTDNNDITAYLKIKGKTMILTSQDDTKVTLSYQNDNRSIAYTNLGLYYKYKGSSELRSATEQSVVPNDGVTTIGSGTIIANIPNTDKREVLLLPLKKKDYSGVNAKPNLRVYHNGVLLRRRVLFDDDSEISLLINSPTGFSAENLIIKKTDQGNRILGEGEYEVESLSFGSARVHFRNVPALDSGLYKVSFTVPGDGYTRKEYNVSLVRTTSSTRLVKVYPNPYKYGEHDQLKIEYFIPRNAKKSEYILLMVNILGDEMDSVPMSSVLDNVGKVYWNTFMVRKNYKPGLYMIALTDKKKRKVYDRKYILVEK